jgi:hypothetical protein
VSGENQVIASAEMEGSVGEAISAMATAILRENSSLSKYFRDVSSFATKGVSTITFPRLGKFAVQNRGSGQKGERQTNSVIPESLPLDKKAYISYGIDGADEVQSTLNWKLECAKIASEDHAEYFNESFITLLESVATTVDVQLETGDVEEVRTMTKARKALLDNKGKLERSVWIISTDLEERIISNPSLFAVTGLGTALIVEGKLQKLWGIPVEVKTMSEDFLLADGYAVNYGFQKAPKYAEVADLDYGTDGMRAALDQLFGMGCSYMDSGKCLVVFKKGTVTPAA